MEPLTQTMSNDGKNSTSKAGIKFESAGDVFVTMFSPTAEPAIKKILVRHLSIESRVSKKHLMRRLSGETLMLKMDDFTIGFYQTPPEPG